MLISTGENNNVAAILERSIASTIDEWLKRVLLSKDLMELAISDEARCRHLPQILRDIIGRLQSNAFRDTVATKSVSAERYGTERYLQGYSLSMLVEEAKLLELSIYQTLQNKRDQLDWDRVLIGVMTIADEVDAQLSQATESYMRGRGTNP